RAERARPVLGASGPGAHPPPPPARAAAAAADAVRGLADRLVGAGLAVPPGARTNVAAGVRQVRAAAVAVLVLGTAALLTPGGSEPPRSLVALWFALPLALAVGCLVIARGEAGPSAPWASPAGQRLLGALARHRGAADDAGDEQSFLTSVAVRGVRAVGGPELRAAFAHREAYERD
ncbi:TIGR04222 domain-containing membrane protein, partial [Streptomyces longwoodensis]|uniref:TIGR04222 domain-containing membrane protein n=1 Tax=Streptomyces longwoodensis TaxID=68231 RepID=UPI0033E7B046